MGVFRDKDSWELTIGFWYHGTLPGWEGATCYEGPLRCRLAVGQSFTHSYGGSTDEGYSYTTETYTFVEDEGGDLYLMRESSTESQDCDGRLDTFSRARAVVLEGHPSWEDPGVMYPMWEKMKLHRGEYAQRDYTAEAAGY